MPDIPTGSARDHALATLRRLVRRTGQALGVRSSRADADARREIASHVQLLEDEFLRRGFAVDEARRQARLALGGVEQARGLHHAARSLRWLGDLRRDVVYGLRLFRRSPGFAAISVISIAFGTGANVAIFSGADTLLLRPLPISRPGDVLVIGSATALSDEGWATMSYPDYLDVRRQSQSFSGLTAHHFETAALVNGPGAVPRVAVAMLVSANFFDVLGVRPAIGRSFRAEEERLGLGPVAVLSHALWETEFGSNESVVGRQIRVGRADLTVIGVAPERFTGLERDIAAAVYIPVGMWPDVADVKGVDGLPSVNPLADRNLRVFKVRARLAPGMSRTSASSEVSTLCGALTASYPATNAGYHCFVQTDFEARFASNPLEVGMVIVLSILSIAVLAVACANVAGLLAGRGTARAREIAMRLAVGAGRARLIRQLLTESILIALAGGAIGILLAHSGIAMLRQIRYPSDLFTPPTIVLDQRAFLMSLAIAMTSAITFGLAPAFYTTRVDLITALKSGGATTGPGPRLRGRSVLVATQVALSLVMLTIALFTFRVFSVELGQGPGFRHARMARIGVDVSQTPRSDADVVRFYGDLLARARVLPGVTGSALTRNIPLNHITTIAILPEGYQAGRGEPSLDIFTTAVDPSYFATMEIPIVTGRAFAPTDDADNPRVAIVNEVVAARYWPSQSVVGRRFRLGGDAGPLVQIVGVAKTAKYIYFAESPQEMIYFPFMQQASDAMTLLVTTDGDSAPLPAAMRTLVLDMDDRVPTVDAMTMETFYDIIVTRIARVIAWLVAILGVVGVSLTMIGLYGLVSFSASRRTREMGIRVAVGATYGQLLGMVVAQGMKPAWWGLAAGLVLSVVAAKILPMMQFRVAHTLDVRVFILVAAAIVVTALTAVFVPAIRAARVNPVDALRAE